MSGTPVLFGATAVGLGVGAKLAGAPWYTLLLSAAVAIAVCTVVLLSVQINRRAIMIEVLKLGVTRGQGARGGQAMDLDSTHAVPVMVNGVEALVGVTDGKPVADATVLRFTMDRARARAGKRGVAS